MSKQKTNKKTKVTMKTTSKIIAIDARSIDEPNWCKIQKIRRSRNNILAKKIKRIASKIDAMGDCYDDAIDLIFSIIEYIKSDAQYCEVEDTLSELNYVLDGDEFDEVEFLACSYQEPSVKERLWSLSLTADSIIKQMSDAPFIEISIDSSDDEIGEWIENHPNESKIFETYDKVCSQIAYWKSQL